MDNHFQTLLVIFISIVILFVFPVYFAYEKKDDMSYALVLKYTENFVSDVKSTGYITKEKYDQYLDNLASTRNKFNIQIEHKIKKYYPNGENEYTTLYEIKENSHILNEIESSGIYTMNKGDTFSIEVKNTNTTIATVIYNIITINSSDENTRIYVNSSTEILKASWQDKNYEDIFKIKEEEIEESIEINESNSLLYSRTKEQLLVGNGEIPYDINGVEVIYSKNYIVEFQTEPLQTIKITPEDIGILNIQNNEKFIYSNLEFTYRPDNFLLNTNLYQNIDIKISVGTNGIVVSAYDDDPSVLKRYSVVSYEGNISKDNIYRVVFKEEEKSNIVAIFENDKRIAFRTFEKLDERFLDLVVRGKYSKYGSLRSFFWINKEDITISSSYLYYFGRTEYVKIYKTD